MKRGSPFYQIVCPLESTGPIFSLLYKLNAFNTSFLVKGIAALITHRFIEQEIPWPEGIISIPSSFVTSFFQGNSSSSLAYAVAEILEVPILSPAEIADKKVLLVGEQLNPQFFAAGASLIEKCPYSLIGAAACNNIYQ